MWSTDDGRMRFGSRSDFTGASSPSLARFMIVAGFDDIVEGERRSLATGRGEPVLAGSVRDVGRIARAG